MFLHIDIDSFFISAERSIDPTLKGIRTCVGSRSNLEIFSKKRVGIHLINDNSGAFVTPVFYSNKKKSFRSHFIDIIDGKEKIRGIVTTASYEARACGVKTGMALSHALSLCPKLIIVPSNYPLYHRLSYKIHHFLQERIPKIEQFSIDEFFVDISGWVEEGRKEEFAKEIQSELLHHFDIPVSIGIAKSKWIAKLATEDAKPYGIFKVDDIFAYIEDKPIEEFPGIGKGFARRLHQRYIKTLGDVRRHKGLLYSWKKPGIQLYNRVVGIDNEGIGKKPDRKSIGISRTFDQIYDPKELKRRVMVMARHIAHIASQIEVNPTLYYLKINYEYGIKAKESKRVDRVFSELLLKEELREIFQRIHQQNIGATKLSVSISDFASKNHRTLSILTLNEDREKHLLDEAFKKIRNYYGLDAIKTGGELG